jgi:endoglucanase
VLAAVAAAAFTAVGLTAATANAEAVEHVQNGTFDSGTTPWWWTGNAPGSVVDGAMCAPIPAGTTNPWDAILGQNDIPLTDGTAYTLSFSALADQPVTIRANVQLGVEPWTTAFSRDIPIGAAQTYTYTFTSNVDSPGGQIAFQVGGNAAAFTFCFDNVSLTSDDAPPPSTTERLVNGGFDNGTAGWFVYGTTTSGVAGGRLCATVPGGLANPWDAGIGQNDVPLVEGTSYTLRFTLSTATPATLRAVVQLGADPFTGVFFQQLQTGAEQAHLYTFTPSLTTEAGQVVFHLGGNAAPVDLCLDDVSLVGGDPPAGPEQVSNGDFSNGTNGWYNYGVSAPVIDDGRMCAGVPGGLANPWDAGLGQNDIPLINGAQYRFSLEASADPGATVRVNVQLAEDPFTAYFSRDLALTTTTQRFEYTFTAGADSQRAQVAFQVGANANAYRLCIDNVSLQGGEAEPPYVPDTGPRVRVNQVGYLPQGPKNATIVTAATDPVAWELHNGAGTVVASGLTTPRGMDEASGQDVHTVDFSSITATGTGYTLTADGETSFPFDISAHVYDQLRSDALQFFYLQRSGIAIDGALVGAQYARPAGHVGVAPNQGDTSVPCQPGGCGYPLDVRGGWYDAGDQGKYVVNGGIATYQLLSTFERTKYAITAVPGALGDSTLRVPERGNGVPDVLDEARWELEFLMRMQVPAGQPLAGMAHHKVHDQNWTGLPMQPQNDDQLRELHPPSTAATLNLAATAAQCARLFAPYDAAFAGRCLTAARTAYAAAKAHPAVYASGADGNGGGAYSDDDVTDEFYWAAAELFITTGEAQFRTDLTSSPHHTGNVFTSTGFGWPATAAIGRMDLATVPNLLPAADRARIRQSVVDAATMYLQTLYGQAYGLPMPGNAGHYFWGSSSNIINNVIVLATAFDLTGNQALRAGALQGMDYIFGRNALNHSYVTGWGEKSPQNQHTRTFAHQLDASLPNPPAGSIAGGANAGLDDPFAANLLRGCKPQFCYVDDINSYATNEIAINWNSALAWIASFLADQREAAPLPAPTCRVTYTIHGTWPGGFNAQIIIQNTGPVPIDGWQVRWSFLAGQGYRDIWSVAASQSGATVTANNLSWNARILPGQSVTFGFIGTDPGGPNPTPGLFALNAGACTVT